MSEINWKRDRSAANWICYGEDTKMDTVPKIHMAYNSKLIYRELPKCGFKWTVTIIWHRFLKKFCTLWKCSKSNLVGSINSHFYEKLSNKWSTVYTASSVSQNEGWHFVVCKKRVMSCFRSLKGNFWPTEKNHSCERISAIGRTKKIINGTFSCV